MLRDLVEPLWLPIFVLAVVWFAWWRRSLTRWSRITGTAALAVLWLVSTPFAAFVLEIPLATESRVDDDWSPDFIYVLAGGYDIGDLAEADTNGLETTRRVNRGVQLWREHRGATIVMAGGQPGMGGLRVPEQQGLLMQAQAERLGVPETSIVIDSVSLNTNGHAKVARDAGLHGTDARLAIVTSDFHLRRARREFSRFFGDIRLYGSDPEITDDSWSDLSPASMIPRVDALRDSTTYLREYVALMLSDIRN
ncbi:MAG: YdcF family protein [Acidimicrobiia bacterium]